MATVEDFLRTYGLSDWSGHQVLWIDFSKYIIICCWEKMLRWMEHWFSYKVVQVLGRATRKSLQESFNKAVQDRVFSLSICEDSMLGGLLIVNNLSSNVQDLLNRLCPFPDFIPDVSKLVTAFNNTRTPKGSARTPGLGWYIKTNFTNFSSPQSSPMEICFAFSSDTRRIQPALNRFGNLGTYSGALRTPVSSATI